MKKILSITTVIPIKTYNNIAYPLSIIFSKFNNAKNWLFQNSFSLKYGTEVNDVTLSLPYNMDWKCFEKKSLKNNTSLKDIIYEINQERYVYLAVNERYIPHRESFQKEDFIHDILVYGFDEEQREFYVVGFNEYHVYVCQKISFSDLENALKSTLNVFQYDTFEYEFFGAGNNFSLSMKKIEIDKLDDAVFRKLLLKYLNGEKLYSHTNCICYTGLQIYEKLLQDDKAICDYRNWNIIKEHTIFIAEGIKKYVDISFLNEMLNELIKDTQISLKLCLKYKIDRKESSLERLKKNTSELFELNKKIMMQILERLDKNK